MAPRKRARASASSAAAAATLVLDGGEPLSAGLVGLWRAGRLTDVEVGGQHRTPKYARAYLAVTGGNAPYTRCRAVGCARAMRGDL